MTSPLTWRKSSYTDPNACVELAWPVEAVAIRDSKNRTGPTLSFPRTNLATFLASITH